MDEAVVEGVCVLAPFGQGEQIGYVAARRNVAPRDPLFPQLKRLTAVLEGGLRLQPDQLELAHWLSERYCCDLAASLRLLAPSAFLARVITHVNMKLGVDPRNPASGFTEPQTKLLTLLESMGSMVELEKLKHVSRLSTFQTVYTSLKRKGVIFETREVRPPKTNQKTMRAFELPATLGDASTVSPAGQKILEALYDFHERGEVPVIASVLLEEAGVSEAALKTLVKSGLVRQVSLPIRRMATVIPEKRTVAPELAVSQRAACNWVARALDLVSAAEEAGDRKVDAKDRTALLFGVTASGKSEVYLDAIARTRAKGKSAILLVPEIALTQQLVEVFTGRFGDDVAVLHSALSDGERHDEWQRIREGKAGIVVGARSAIFAPAPNLGIIVIDEEHEATYKQDSYPRYSAKTVAIRRADESGAVLLLGSATPSMETFHEALEGRIELLRMPERIDSRPLPAVKIVDLREEYKERRALFSQVLQDAIAERLSTGKQVILFLNRRGFNQFVLCRDCGYVAKCEHCAVSMAYHSGAKILRCHHCNAVQSVPEKCPDCQSERIQGFGLGTERVEIEAQALFPEARIVRLDRDTTARKGAHADILRRFRSGDANLLIGTQMVTKGLDFPNVTLVGVVSADTALNMPDFRAAERSFQLITQVAGRAGRGQDPGEVIVQTFNPEHPSLLTAAKHDYEAFYRDEIEHRQELVYPPFSRLANLVCADADNAEAQAVSEAMAEAVIETAPKGVEVMGPAPAPLMRLRGEFRFHVVLRAPLETELEHIVSASMKQLPVARRASVTIDIDPMSLA
jgi:primosomal protein N' (replication factor Y)